MSTHAPRSGDPGFARIVERQMRNWELSHQATMGASSRQKQPVHEFIALSRAVGLPGEAVAEALSQKLGWPCFDKDILELMAGDNDYRRRLYQHLDERDMGWLESILQSFGREGLTRDDYYHRLQSTVLALARKGPAIFLGRAADLILPNGAGLRVRLHASKEYCIEAYARAHHLTDRDATRQVEQAERDRAKFIENHFALDSTSSSRHDLILNMERWSLPESVDIILKALALRRIAEVSVPASQAAPPIVAVHEVKSP